MKIFVDRRPGEFMFVICSPKSYHRTAVAIEDAGYEIRDCIMYLYSLHDRVMYIPICVARKPLEGTVVNNVIKYGCGGLNIDGCRIGTDPVTTNAKDSRSSWGKTHLAGFRGCAASTHTGRWPANIIHDGSDIVVNAFPHTKSGVLKTKSQFTAWHTKRDMVEWNGTSGTEGSAARYFHCAPTLHDVVTYLRKMI